MDTQVKCRFCDAHNVSSALSCAHCFMPIVDDFGDAWGGSPAGSNGTSAPPAPPAPIEYGPYTGPPKKPQADTPPDDPEPDSPVTTLVAPGFRLGGTIIAGANGAVAAAAPMRLPGDPNRIKWRWYHLWLFGTLTWGVPSALGAVEDLNRPISDLLSRGLAVQIVGYLLGLLVVAGFVWSRQNGDWGSLGIRRTESSRRDLMRGALFGGAMFAGYLPVALMLSSGKFSLDYLAKLIIGNASGVGLVLAAIVVIVGAPIIEEIYYRGMLYEKLARRSRFVAVALSTILFTAAHGALFIPAITLLGGALAIRRAKESLWFTMGAHSAWNAIVTVVAVFVLVGGGVSYSSSSGALHLQYPRDWDRHTEAEVPMPMGAISGGIDLALESANGSGIMVMEMTLPSVPNKAELRRRLANLPSLSSMVGGAQLKSAHESDLDLKGDPVALEMSLSTNVQGVDVEGTVLAVIPDNSTTMYMFVLICPTASCAPATVDFETMLTTATFGAAA